jgi:hypothetical protein
VAFGNYIHTEDNKELLQVNETKEIGATATWAPGPSFTEDWNMKVAEVLPDINGQNNSEYLRFASFQVMVLF